MAMHFVIYCNFSLMEMKQHIQQPNVIVELGAQNFRNFSSLDIKHIQDYYFFVDKMTYFLS
jgi:hypothetical protein